MKLVQIINSETVDESYKKSALEQLAILLQGAYEGRPLYKGQKGWVPSVCPLFRVSTLEIPKVFIKMEVS